MTNRSLNRFDKVSVLVLDDNPDVLLAAEIVLKAEFPSVQIESDPKNLPALLKQNDFDVVLLDMNYSPVKGHIDDGLCWC
jgi:two-component system response regulator HydG